MKRWGLALLVVAIVITSFAQADTPPNREGRFQLVTATVRISGSGAAGGASSNEEKLFRIDTSTGTTWIYIETFDMDKRQTLAGWLPVREVPNTYGMPKP